MDDLDGVAGTSLILGQLELAGDANAKRSS